MPEFILDTSGHITGKREGVVADVQTHWVDLNAFTQGYIEALFFTNDRLCLDNDGIEVGFSDLAPATLAKIIADCQAFQAKASGLLAQAHLAGYSEDQAGRDFWFTRNGHGVGFWDRDALQAESLGDSLTALCQNEPLDVYLGDDGKVYLS